jgi:hypothetical protein
MDLMERCRRVMLSTGDAVYEQRCLERCCPSAMLPMSNRRVLTIGRQQLAAPAMIQQYGCMLMDCMDAREHRIIRKRMAAEPR